MMLRNKKSLFTKNCKMEIDKLNKEIISDIVEECLIEIPPEDKFKLLSIEQVYDKEIKCSKFIIKTKSFQDKDWFILLRQKRCSLEKEDLKKIIFHELGHYFFEEDNNMEIEELENLVNGYIEKNWNIKKLKSSIPLALYYIYEPIGILFAESCRIKYPKW